MLVKFIDRIFFNACCNGDLQKILLIYPDIADINICNRKDKSKNVFYYAFRNNHFDVCEFLIRNNCELQFELQQYINSNVNTIYDKIDFLIKMRHFLNDSDVNNPLGKFHIERLINSLLMDYNFDSVKIICNKLNLNADKYILEFIQNNTTKNPRKMVSLRNYNLEILLNES